MQRGRVKEDHENPAHSLDNIDPARVPALIASIAVEFQCRVIAPPAGRHQSRADQQGQHPDRGAGHGQNNGTAGGDRGAAAQWTLIRAGITNRARSQASGRSDRSTRAHDPSNAGLQSRTGIFAQRR